MTLLDSDNVRRALKLSTLPSGSSMETEQRMECLFSLHWKMIYRWAYAEFLHGNLFCCCSIGGSFVNDVIFCVKI